MEVHKIARCPEHGLHGQREECFECGGPVDQVEMVSVEDVATQPFIWPKIIRKLQRGWLIQYDPQTVCFFLWEGSDPVEVVDGVTGEVPHVFYLERGGFSDIEVPDLIEEFISDWRHRRGISPVEDCTCDDCEIARNREIQESLR